MMIKWCLILADKFGQTKLVKEFDTKEEALEALTDQLEKEPVNISFYAIRKDEPFQPFKETEMGARGLYN